MRSLDIMAMLPGCEWQAHAQETPASIAVGDCGDIIAAGSAQQLVARAAPPVCVATL